MATHYNIRGGIDTTAMYKKETTFASDPGSWSGTGDSEPIHFGITQSITPSVSRSLIKTRGLSGALPTANTSATSRDALQLLAGKSEVSMDVEYQPQDFSFLEYVYGSVSGTTTKYYPQQSASLEADKKKYIKLPSISVMERFDFGGTGDYTDTALTFTGLKVNSWSMKGAIGEPISCSTNLMGSDLLFTQTSVSTNYPYVALSTDDVFHFIESQIQIGSTAIPNLIDGFEFSVENSCEGLGDIRSYVNENVISKQRDFALNIDMKAESISYIKNMLGTGGTGITTPVEISEITLTLTKSGKVLTLVLKNLKQSDGIPPVTYGSVVEEKIKLVPEYAYFTETDS
jgi:hypothetical protein